MKSNNQLKRLILISLMLLSLIIMVACSSGNSTKQTEDIVIDKDQDQENEEEVSEEVNKLEETKETQLENEILSILGFSEEKDKIERYGGDDEASDDQSVNVNDNDGDLELFLSISKESTGIDSAGDGPMVGLDVRHDVTRGKDQISMMEDLTKELIKTIAKYEYVDWIGIEHSIPKNDNSNNDKALSITVERDTLNKINWDTFDSEKLETNVDSYRLADDIR